METKDLCIYRLLWETALRNNVREDTEKWFDLYLQLVEDTATAGDLLAAQDETLIMLNIMDQYGGNSEAASFQMGRLILLMQNPSCNSFPLLAKTPEGYALGTKMLLVLANIAEYKAVYAVAFKERLLTGVAMLTGTKLADIPPGRIQETIGKAVLGNNWALFDTLYDVQKKDAACLSSAFDMVKTLVGRAVPANLSDMTAKLPDDLTSPT